MKKHVPETLDTMEDAALLPVYLKNMCVLPIYMKNHVMQW